MSASATLDVPNWDQPTSKLYEDERCAMVGVVVIPQPGANHIEIANAVYDRMEKMKKDLPEDVHYNYGFDNTKFIRASIDEVKQTVYEAFVLVIIIIFLFLRDWRVTLVPCIVIPVSLIGAFFVMYLAGFSINVLSMLAVVLAVAWWWTTPS